ncbi:MAG: DNA recombination protein RmuC [Phycisphaerae bacterium]|jgi:DNA recombination protein RmuC
MFEWVGFILGVALSALVALALWLRARGGAQREAAALQARVSGFEAETAALRQQCARHDEETAKLREALAAEQQARVRAETQLAEARRGIDEQRKLLADAELRLKDVFAALAADTLRSNSEQFVRQAEEKVKPLREALERFERQVQELERVRQSAYGRVSEQLETVSKTGQLLQRETSHLVTALRAPQVRGRWGELTLQRVVELAGLVQHCDFETQVSVATDDGRLRPDMIVRLPGERRIVVDAKVSLDAYLDAVAAGDEAARRGALERHARQLREHMKRLADKAYWKQFERTPDFVVMFVPGESFFSAALEQDRTLIEDGIAERVILATPTTLIALLRTVAHGWQQHELLENAERIGHAAEELFKRVKTFADHLEDVGKALTKASESYNRAVSSWESRVVPAGRRVAALHTKLGEAVPAVLPPVEATPRTPRESDAESLMGNANDDRERD